MLATTMLTIIGLMMVIVIVYSLMQSKTTPVTVFALIPVVAILLFNLFSWMGFLHDHATIAVLVKEIKKFPKELLFLPTQTTYTINQIAGFVHYGVGTTWSVAALFIFSITFFGVLTEAGMFEPMVNFLVRKAGSNVILVTLATGAIATVAHLDGSLAVTLLITVPAMLPIYKKLNMRPITILIIIGAAMSVMNLLPWGGPVARVATVQKMDLNELWHQLIPLQFAGVIVVLLFSALLGYLEKRRGAGLALQSSEFVVTGGGTIAMGGGNGAITGNGSESSSKPWTMRQHFNMALFGIAIIGIVASVSMKMPVAYPIMSCAAIGLIVNYIAYRMGSIEKADLSHVEDEKKRALMRPELLAANVCITILTLSMLAFFSMFQPYYCFMAGLSVALAVNYPEPKLQAARIKAHAGDALSMAAILLASGVFLGILTGSGMIEAMARSIVSIVPDALGHYLHLVLGVLSIPIGMLLGTDSFFYGFVPVATNVGAKFGIDPLNMAKTLLIAKNYGVIVTPHAATTFLAIGLAGVELKEHLKVVTAWMWPLGIFSMFVALLLGIITI